MKNLVPEIKVLIASAVWLWKDRKVRPLQFSVASGKGIDMYSDKKRLQDALKAAGVPDSSTLQNNLGIHQFLPAGPDIIGLSATEFWQIECKGSGIGKKQTQRNNFDRALASVVSYYNEDLDLPNLPNLALYLGLALPATSDYVLELRNRVKRPLRSRLNMWILLYDSETQVIRPIAPGDKYD